MIPRYSIANRDLRRHFRRATALVVSALVDEDGDTWIVGPPLSPYHWRLKVTPELAETVATVFAEDPERRRVRHAVNELRQDFEDGAEHWGIT